MEAYPECKKLLKLEGVGTLNAINLYVALGCAELGVFEKGKNARIFPRDRVPRHNFDRFRGFGPIHKTRIVSERITMTSPNLPKRTG